MTLTVARTLYNSDTTPNASEDTTMTAEKFTADTITDDQIQALKADAEQHQDPGTVRICTAALVGSAHRACGILATRGCRFGRGPGGGGEPGWYEGKRWLGYNATAALKQLCADIVNEARSQAAA